jgi:DNA-binding transcriptional LysR family regulator
MRHSLYAAAGHAVRSVDDARLIGWTEAFAHLPAARWLSAAVGRKPDLAFSSLTAQVAAVRAGLGVALLPRFLAEKLEEIPAVSAPVEPIWLVSHRDAVDRVIAVKAEISRIMAASAKQLDGMKQA